MSRTLLERAAQWKGTLVALVVAFALVWIGVHGPQGLDALLEKNREIRRLEAQNAELQRDIDQRREHIRRLQDSTSEKEMEIRKKLKLVRPGETTFMLPNAPPDPGQDSSPKDAVPEQ